MSTLARVPYLAQIIIQRRNHAEPNQDCLKKQSTTVQLLPNPSTLRIRRGFHRRIDPRIRPQRGTGGTARPHRCAWATRQATRSRRSYDSCSCTADLHTAQNPRIDKFRARSHHVRGESTEYTVWIKRRLWRHGRIPRRCCIVPRGPGVVPTHVEGETARLGSVRERRESRCGWLSIAEVIKDEGTSWGGGVLGSGAGAIARARARVAIHSLEARLRVWWRTATFGVCAALAARTGYARECRWEIAGTISDDVNSEGVWLADGDLGNVVIAVVTVVKRVDIITITATRLREEMKKRM